VEVDEEMLGSPADRCFPASPPDTRLGDFWVLEIPLWYEPWYETGEKEEAGRLANKGRLQVE
jgi:hypothetical protein